MGLKTINGKRTSKISKPKYDAAFNKGVNAMSNLETKITNKVQGLFKRVLGQPEGTYFSSVGAIATSTISAGNNIRVESRYDLGSEMRSLGLGLSEDQLIFDKYILSYDLWSTAPFGVQPFFCIQENGESITTTEAASDDVATQIDSATGSQTKDIQYSNIEYSSISYQNGTPYFKAKITLDLTEYCNKYLRDLKDKELNESSPSYLEMFVGWALIGVASQQINRVALFSKASHKTPYRMKRML